MSLHSFDDSESKPDPCAIECAIEPEVHSGPPAFASAKIMLTDDEPTTLEILEVLLENEGYENIITTTDSRQALALVNEHRPDALLLDLMMPHVGGLEILQAIRSDDSIRHTPVITLTSSTDAGTKLRALELGATDFLAKPVDPSELALRLRNTLAAKAYQDRLLYYDAVTELPNRLHFLDRLKRMLQRAKSTSVECALIHIDLDRFKQINAAVGHSFADRLLREVAHRIDEVLRPTDMLGIPGMADEANPLSRVGGDEFSLLLPGAGATDRAARVAMRIQNALSAPFQIEGKDLFVTCSMGISLYPADGTNAEALLGHAEVALREAKQGGRKDFRFYDRSLNLESAERFGLEHDLHRALERKQLYLLYQPKLDIASGQITGVEALMRWQHPELGLIGPDRFIPIAEETNLIEPLGEWALRTGCQQAMAWQQNDLSIAVNVSLQQFLGGRLVETVRQALHDSGLDPRHLVLELTETVLMDDAIETAEMLDSIKAMGVQVSIDDFGTGYSSLSYLKRFPIDELKIDRSFITGVPDREDDAAIATAIIRMGHALGLSVIAEGVETVGQLEFLAARGCDKYQGYLFRPPVPASEITELLSSKA
jgi:diguanylate cyclase (GGDEF)-like protein